MLEPAHNGQDRQFAHNSERQFALLLDFYGIPWEYEPTSFPIAWDRNKQPTQFFTPDFYLPEDDLYIEITTMSQKLVTKKNAKVRRLKELHPGVRCKVLYQRDYLHLVLKYGLEQAENLEARAAPTRIPGPPRVVRLDDRGAGPR
jgi:hypoxanthine phosphoribosyltransferase